MTLNISDLVNEGFKPIDLDNSIYFSPERRTFVILPPEEFYKEKVTEQQKEEYFNVALRTIASAVGPFLSFALAFSTEGIGVD